MEKGGGEIWKEEEPLSGMDSCCRQLLSNTEYKGQSSLYFRHFNFKKKIFVRTDAWPHAHPAQCQSLWDLMCLETR